MAKSGDKASNRLTIMVSSTVYGIEELLEQVYALLSGFGYEVWCSHKGTVPVYPNQTAFGSCLEAVKRCDLFLGIITPHYGSGAAGGGLSITHQELLKAIELNKPRWILAHDHVPFARAFFQKFQCKNAAQRNKMLKKLGYDTPTKTKNLKKRQNAIIDDFRVIDMYEAAIRHDLKVYQNRKGNWVQQFANSDEAKLFATAQFFRYRAVEQFLHDHFKDKRAVHSRLGRRSGS